MPLKSGQLRKGLRNTSVGVSAIPDSGMFQSPLYQFWAGDLEVSDGSTQVPFPEVLAGLSDATAVGGPIYRSNQSGFQAVEYDGADDAHDWTPDSSIPSGADPHSLAVLVYQPSGASDTGSILSWGGAGQNIQTNLRLSSGNIDHDFGGENVNGSALPSGQWATFGMSYDGTNRTLYLNGSSDASDSPGSQSVQNDNHAIGYRRLNTDRWFDGFVAEAIVSDVSEPAQSFSDYHQDRLG